MTRNAFSKVMWVGRATTFLVGLAVVLALVFGAATTAMGANGNGLLLGVLNNAATKVTGLVGNVDGAAALRVTNPNAGTNDTALDLRVQPGEAPMRVNSSKKVTNLNADQVDGLDSTRFASGTGGKADDADLLDGKDSGAFATGTNGKADSALFADLAGDTDKIDGKDSSALWSGKTYFKAQMFNGTANASTSGSVGCDTGDVALGGGYTFDGSGFEVFEEFTGRFDHRVSWWNGSTPAVADVYVRCADFGTPHQ